MHTLRAYDVLSDRLGLAENALAGRVVELGFDIEYSPALRAVKVTAVRKGTPAEAAGVLAGDLIVSVDGRTAARLGGLSRRRLREPPAG